MSNNLEFSKGMEDGRLKLGSEAGGQCDKGFSAKAGRSGLSTGTSLAPGKLLLSSSSSVSLSYSVVG